MSQKKDHITYAAADIEKYHKGLLSAKEMHAMEKAALGDPFLADALEGYTAHHASIPTDIAELKKRLANRTGEEKKVIPITTETKPSFSWWKAAAMIVLIAGAGLLVYQFGFNRKPGNIAGTTQKETVKPPENKTDTAPSELPDTDTVATSTVAAGKGKDKSSARDNKALESPVSQEEVSQENKKSQLKDNKEPQVKTRLSPSPTIPVLATEKTKEEAIDDNARRERIPTEKAEELKARKQPEAADIVTTDIPQKRAVAAQNRGVEGFYKDQRNKAYNQAKIFRGRVTDSQHNPLPFSNITNIQDTVGTYADANGYFNLISPDSVLNVRVSSIGFKPSNVQLQNNVPTNNVLLQEDRSGLAEVVIGNKKVNSNRSSSLVLEEPEPADGWVNYDLYLANNLKESDVEFREKSAGTRGEVELSFDINNYGEPINITVKKSLCEACDKEAIRLLKEGPRWKKKGKKSKARVTVGF